MEEFVFLNGQIVKSKEATIQISDLAILRGYGVFDFLRVIDAKPIFLDDYLDRFERSVMGLALHLPYTKQDLREKIYDLIGLHKHHLLGVRMVCTGGYADDAYTPTLSNTFIIVKPLHFHPYDQGLHLMSVDFQRDLYHIKSINYLRPISLLQEMKAVHADDVLYHKDGYVTESSRSNVFIIKKGVLITPDSGMLEGITRMKIIQYAKEILPIEIRPVTLKEVMEADEVFLSATTKRISPVTKIDGHTFPKGKYTKLLYDKLILEEMMS